MKTLKHISLCTAIIFGISASVLSQSVGEQAPDFTLTSLMGESFTLSEQNGKVVFMFLFGWNCTHCKSNGPNTETDIYAKFKDNPDFVAVGIETWDGNVSSTQSYVTLTKLTYPVLLEGSNLLSSYSTTYDRIIVVDPTGTIKYKSSDNATKDITAEAQSVISSLLEETSTIEDIQNTNKHFQIAPNPVSNQLVFKNPAKNPVQAQLIIYDVKGQPIMNETIELSENNTIDVSSFSPGYYVIHLISNTTSWSEQFTKIQ